MGNALLMAYGHSAAAAAAVINRVCAVLQGFVYLKFDSPTAAQAAAKVLHGRFYNGNLIVAEYQFLQTYNQFFGLH